MKTKTALSKERQLEVIGLYRDAGQNVHEIADTYTINVSTVYEILKRNGVPTRINRKGLGGRRSAAKPEADNGAYTRPLSVNPLQLPPVAQPIVGTRPNGGMVVMTDASGNVLSARRDGDAAKMPCYEVTVEVISRATREVRAASLEEAIHRAKTDPAVRRVVGVMEKPPAE